MEKVNKKEIRKEIRLTFNLENDKDKILYEKILSLSNTQPSRIVKRILTENIDKEFEDNPNDLLNFKLLDTLDKICNKLDNLNVNNNIGFNSSNCLNNKEEDNNKDNKEIEFNEDLNEDDINDLEF